MQEPLNITEIEVTDSASRRASLTRFAAMGAGLAVLKLSAQAQTPMAGDRPMMPPAPMSAMPMPDPAMPGTLRVAAMPKNEMEYRVAIAPIAMLSLETSRIAVLKAVDPAVRQFATFELAEAVAVTNVLKDLGTPMPPMNPMDRDTVSKAQNAPAGADFDRDYITKQRAAHIYLRDTATNYLGAPMPRKAKMPEKHGRHLATLNLPVFIEHVTHTEDITRAMMA